ncbi:unnamed protein product, partial [Urochloa humidicola]
LAPSHFLPCRTHPLPTEDGAASRFLSPLDPLQTFSGGVEVKRDRAAASCGPPKSPSVGCAPATPPNQMASDGSGGTNTRPASGRERGGRRRACSLLPTTASSMRVHEEVVALKELYRDLLTQKLKKVPRVRGRIEEEDERC